MLELSENTITRMQSVFPEKYWNEVEEYLTKECGNNIPFCEKNDKYQMERIRFSVLKLSEGNLEKLVQAVELAKTDWRDLFMAAGFGYDVDAHNKWMP